MVKKSALKIPVTILIPLFLFLSISFAEELAQPVYSVKEELDVKVTMRDGIRLSTNIYRPDDPGKFPALLMRTPYSNGGSGNTSGQFFAKRGYAVVIQDTRGRYESEGVFDAFQPEALDGYDMQQWVGNQPWCNGKIGTFGGSYVGFTQWLPAPFQSPYLVTMFPVVTFADFHDMVYYGGAARVSLFSSWSFEMSIPYGFDPKRMLEQQNKILQSLPLIEQDKVAGWKIPFLRDWLAHPEHDLYWERTSIKNGYSKIKASAYNVGGWFDICLAGTLKNFTAMTSKDIDPGIRGKQKLLIGPWVHSLSKDGKVGEMDFGKDAVVDMQELELQWFDSQLKGKDTGITNQDPVRIFVMGENVWRNEKEWPLARTKYRNYYFHSGGRANTLKGDGVLDTINPDKEKPDRFVYDPGNPVSSSPDSPTGQNAVEEREDVLVYSTALLPEAVEVTGPVEVLVYASSSAPNTDFTAKLVDVYPDGKAIRLCDGIIRASFRDGDTNTSNIEPDKIYIYRIDLWATSNVFKKGHRIRVEISSSNFPRFNRNLNTGGNCATDSTWVEAQQTLYHSKEYPSCIVLPVIE